ncbi:hypothetical protein NDU88_008545 [Pleurodeles waltl]|uniref:Uncharacterized protein n=1 Tax=Pleurodeles waltl TaxID=8319 RepID=A0AAV7QUU3_PLEWA|nr:hypothetical protein NDU88_008545 [Pleurodeles waltl]
MSAPTRVPGSRLPGADSRAQTGPGLPHLLGVSRGASRAQPCPLKMAFSAQGGTRAQNVQQSGKKCRHTARAAELRLGRHPRGLGTAVPGSSHVRPVAREHPLLAHNAASRTLKVRVRPHKLRPV